MMFSRRNWQDETGVALVMSLLVLILLTIIMIGAFQFGALDLLVSQNSVDQPAALEAALTCESAKVADGRNVDQQVQLRERIAADGNHIVLDARARSPLSCESFLVKDEAGNPLLIARAPVLGASASINTVIYRYQSVGSSRRGSTSRILSDIPMVETSGSGGRR
jgi:hypothetical protein